MLEVFSFLFVNIKIVRRNFDVVLWKTFFLWFDGTIELLKVISSKSNVRESGKKDYLSNDFFKI